MGYPELHSDEKILMTTQDVFVKSIPFEAILTNKRIILIDRKKNLIPQKDILLATVGDIVAAENAIRDQTITLSLITSSGETRQLVLTFSRTAGGGRKRERDEWTKLLKELTSSSIQRTIRKVVPSFDQEPRRKGTEQPPSRIEITTRPGVKKEIEAARPIKTIIETETSPRKTGMRPIPVETGPEVIPIETEPEVIPVKTITEPDTIPPKPVETSSLPIGAFCTRCGNRVPPGSVFCNHCGSRVIPSEEPEKSPAVPARDPVTAPVREPVVVPAREPLPEPVAEPPVVPQVVVESSIPAQKVVVGERKERPIDREIQSIEPLIEGSVPRMAEAPLIPSSKPAEPAPQPAAEPDKVTAPAASESIAKAAQSIIDSVTPASIETPVPAPASLPEGAPAGIPPAGTPAAVAEVPVPPAPEAPSGAPAGSPPPAAGSGSKGRKAAVIVVGILVILAIASVAFLYWNYMSGTGVVTPTPTPTPAITPTITETTAPTTVKTTVPVTKTTVATETPVQVLIPEKGIWVRVTYANTFKGTVGLAGSQQEVGGTGDRFYSVPASVGIIEASIQKADGSGAELLVRIYKDGELAKSGSTTSPRGTVDIQADLRPTTTTATTKATTAPVTAGTTAVPLANTTATA